MKSELYIDWNWYTLSISLRIELCSRIIQANGAETVTPLAYCTPWNKLRLKFDSILLNICTLSFDKFDCFHSQAFDNRQTSSYLRLIFAGICPRWTEQLLVNPTSHLNTSIFDRKARKRNLCALAKMGLTTNKFKLKCLDDLSHCP